MGLRSVLIVLVLGIAIGYFVRDYHPQLESIKKSALELLQKLTSDGKEHEVPKVDKSKPTKETKKAPQDSGKSNTKKSTKSDEKERIFTKDELWEHYRGGKGSKGLHIAIMGRVYDVAKGVKHYGPDGGYSFFAGRDGTKAYASGDFTDEGLTDDLTGVQVSYFGEYENWVKFFDNDYKYVGKLVGKFYDEQGNPTEALDHAHKMMKEARKMKKKDEELKKKFPQCNSEWTQKTGSRVWCTTKSGGIQRDWVGVPRLLRMVGQNQAYCVCIRNTGPPTLGHTTENKDVGDLEYPYLKEYEGCDPNSESCKVVLKDK